MLMSDEKRTSQAKQSSSDLDDLERRLAEARNRHKEPEPDGDNAGSLLGMAWRLSTEFLVAVLVGAGLGYGLDHLLGTRPWFLLVGLVFGFAAGIMSVFRAAGRMDAENAHIPIGEDLPDSETNEMD